MKKGKVIGKGQIVVGVMIVALAAAVWLNTKYLPSGTKYLGESTYVDNILRTSYVCAFASCNFVDPKWFSTGYDINSDLILNSAKLISGASTEGVSFTMKKMSDSTFTDVVTYDSIQVMMWIFQIIAPVALIATGVVVFVRRARR